MKYSIIFMVLLAGGCASPQERQAQYAQNIQSRCEAYGFQPGTDAFANCMMQIDQQNRASAQQFILNQSKPVPQTYQVIQPRPTTNTTCTTFGGQMNCTTR